MTIRVSVAIPVHNEAANLPELLLRLRHMFSQVADCSYELVFVDDGSTDDTLELLESAAAEDPSIVIVALSRNFGHQAALTAALTYVSGDATVIMDGDLQDRPEAIPSLLARFRDGYDVVYVQRTARKESWLLRAAYHSFYRLLARASNVNLPLDAGDFGLISARVVDRLREFPEHHRYLRGLRSWVGFRQVGIEVERDELFAGSSKYTTLRLLKLAGDGLFAFSVVPLRAALMVGALAVVFSSIFAAYALYAKLFLSRSPQGFTATIVIVAFLSGVQLVFLGIIGEYVGRVYEEVKRRPLFIVDRVVRNRSVRTVRLRSES
jgi:polyisoprenyl-phosphate glycosyltransferase